MSSVFEKKPVRLDRVGVVFLFILLSLVFFFPLLTTGYIFDDAYDCTYDYVLKFHHLNIFQATALMSVHCMFTMRRIFPVAVAISIAPFLVFSKLASYKAFQFCAIGLSLFSFFKLLKQLGSDFYFAMSVLVLLLGLIQFREYNDSCLAFSGVMPILTTILTASFLFFDRYLRTNKSIDYFASLLLFYAAILSYEIIYPFVVIFGILSRSRGNDVATSVRHCIPFVAGVGLVAAGSLALKHFVSYADASYQVGTNPASILRAGALQGFATIPFSEMAFGEALSNSQILRIIFGHFLSKVWFCILAFPVSIIVIKNMPEKLGGKLRVELAALSFALLVFPPAVLSLSNRYQSEIRPGLAHVPVYLQYFGAALFLALLLQFLTERRYLFRPVLIIIGASAGLSIFACYQQNLYVVRYFEPWFIDEQIVERALASGLLSELPTDCAIQCLESKHLKDSWQNRYFFYKHAGREFRVRAHDLGNRQLNREFFEIFGNKNFDSEDNPEVVLKSVGLSREKGFVWCVPSYRLRTKEELPITLFVCSSKLTSDEHSVSFLLNALRSACSKGNPRFKVFSKKSFALIKAWGCDQEFPYEHLPINEIL